MQFNFKGVDKQMKQYLVYFHADRKKYFYGIEFKDGYYKSLVEYDNVIPILVTKDIKIAQSVTHNCNLTLNS